MKLIHKHISLSSDVCEMLREKKRKDRRSYSSIIEELLRRELTPKPRAEDIKKIIVKAGEVH